MTDLSRRSLLRAAPLLIAAPAIVRFSSLMPVKELPSPWIAEQLRFLECAVAYADKPYPAINPPNWGAIKVRWRDKYQMVFWDEDTGLITKVVALPLRVISA